MNKIDELEELYYKKKSINNDDRILSCFIQYEYMYQFVGICDKYGNILDANSTALSEAGLTRQDIAYKPFWETYWFSIDDDVKDNLKESCIKAANGEFVRYNTPVNAPHRNKEGIIIIDFNLSPIFNSKNEVVFLLAEGRDITEQKKMENQITEEKLKAEEASRAKSTFLALMTHELRTPLNGIKCLLDIIKSENIDKELGNKIDIIYQSSKNLSHIINTILDYSSFEEDKIKLNKSIFNIKNLIDTTSELLIHKAKKKRLEFIIDVPNIYVETDKIMYSQIIVNLVGNSIKFTETGYIKIKVVEKVRENDRKIITEIIDTGIGMEEETKNNLFTQFYSIDNDRKTKYVGTGLGLAICKKSIEKMGGDIEVETEQGKGSIFRFYFKTKKCIDDSEIENKIEDDIFDENYGELYPLKILISDDVEINRFVISELLKKFGYMNVDIVKDGTEVLEKVAKFDYDLIFMDIRMGTLNGIETTKILKKKYNKLPPIVALTANSLDVDIQNYKDVGMFDYIGKPIEIQQLKNILKKVYDYNIIQNKFE